MIQGTSSYEAIINPFREQQALNTIWVTQLRVNSIDRLLFLNDPY